MGQVAATEPAAECQCATLINVKDDPKRGRCLIVCGAAIGKKYVICRPCALGNHSGQPCRQYVREFMHHLVKTCARCGFDAALHEVGSDGRPN